MSTVLGEVYGAAIRAYVPTLAKCEQDDGVGQRESGYLKQYCKSGWRDGAHLCQDVLGAIDESPRIRARGQRLDIFPPLKVGRTIHALGGESDLSWPKFDGYLVMLFVARSGSSFLSTELEKHYDIGKMTERLNKAEKIISGATQKKIARTKFAGRWFSFKAGMRGVVNAEASGLMDSALGRMHFLRLVRRDIIGQAISTVKAKQTQRWHMSAEAVAEPQYNLAELEKTVAMIASGVEIMRVYAARTGRPCRQIIYEDVADGSLEPALMACDEMGVPRRTGEILKPRSVERMARDSKEDWNERFRSEMGKETRNWLQRYEKMLAT